MLSTRITIILILVVCWAEGDDVGVKAVWLGQETLLQSHETEQEHVLLSYKGGGGVREYKRVKLR